MTTERTEIGRETETALGEVLAHRRGEVPLSCRIVDDPSAELTVIDRDPDAVARALDAVGSGAEATAARTS